MKDGYSTVKKDLLCNGTCEINSQTNVCMGCLRTRDEIDAWDYFSESDKQIVKEAIKKRKIILEIYEGKSPPILSSLS